MTGRSLSARIIIGIVILMVIASAANFGIGLYVGDRMVVGSSRLVDTMQAGLTAKDAAIRQSSDGILTLESERMRARHDAEEHATRLTMEKEQSFLHGQRTGIAASAVTMIRSAMLSGETSSITDLIDVLIEDPNIASINLWRATGVAALSDNETIDAVNKLMGDEVYESRAVGEVKRIEGERAKALRRAVEQLDQDVLLDALIDVEGTETPVVFSYHVLKNTEECQGCHGEATGPRGVLEIAISREALIALKNQADRKLVALDEQQKAEAASLRRDAEARVENVRAESAAMAAAIAAGRSELAAVQSQSRWLLVGVTGVVLVVAVIVMTLFLRRTLSRPLDAMTEAMRALAGGDLETTVPACGRGDEIGQMAGAVQIFKDNMITTAEVSAKQRRAEEEKEHRSRKMEQLMARFDSGVSGVMDAVREATDSMSRLTGDMQQTAARTNQRATEVATVVGEVSQNVDTVATATRELSSSIQEISSQVAHSSDEAKSVAADAETTNQRVRGLSESAERIGEVITLIQGIAEQTNLLALNATIEAARAGDAGKGFAVVASEVKSLATQTAKATEDISDQISEIQSATRDTVAAIQAISATVAEMSRSTTAIAAAVEEQGAATTEIARSVEQTSSATKDVSATIDDVSGATAETGAAAASVARASSHLAEQSDQLNRHVGDFLAGIKAI